jgi:uncharacterized membrane protein
MLDAMLLLSFSLSALAVVGAVGWAARSGNPLAVAAAVLLALGLTALVLLRLAGMLPDRVRTPRFPRAPAVVPGVIAAALLGSLAIASVAQAPVRPSGSQAGTVRGFLGYVVNDNGVGACRYLTARAQDAVQGRPLTNSGCAAVLDEAQLPGVASDAQVGRLHYTVRGRTVTVVGYGERLRFVLRPATRSERIEFQAPPTPWRIASNVSYLA